ncbi:hypothetical protein AM10699_10330 [Acaryochloris marina MBIC10699]|nr:hypothetical protein AM10699_10330 [Acaryochloris marina MBIC10699]
MVIAVYVLLAELHIAMVQGFRQVDRSLNLMTVADDSNGTSLEEAGTQSILHTALHLVFN